jgi:hypothetical protein
LFGSNNVCLGVCERFNLVLNGFNIGCVKYIELARFSHHFLRELADPSRQRSERFPGSLERLQAPSELERRLRTSVRRTSVARLVLGPLVALSAAGLVVWFALTGDEPRPRPYRFEVVHATTLEGLDPLARSLAGSLGGADPR